MTEHLLSVSVTLLFQDLATLPFLVLVAALGMQAGSGAEAVETTIW